MARSETKTRFKLDVGDTTIDVPTSPDQDFHPKAGEPLLHAEKLLLGGGPQIERIKKIAAELFSTRGYRAVGVAEIGDAVGLGRGALYYHISSKEDLLFSIIVQYIEELVKAGRNDMATEPDPRKRIYRLSRKLMSTIFANLSEMTVCFRESDCLTGQRHNIVSDLHRSYFDIWAATFREGAELGIFRKLPTVAVKGILGMYFYSFLWVKTSSKHSAKEIADIFADMALSIAESEFQPEP